MKCISVRLCVHVCVYTQNAYYYFYIYFKHKFISLILLGFRNVHEYQINIGMFIIYFIFIPLFHSFMHSVHCASTNSHRIKKADSILPSSTFIKNFIKKYFSHHHRRRRPHIFFTIWFSVVYIFYFILCRLYVHYFAWNETLKKEISTSIEDCFLESHHSLFSCLLLMKIQSVFFCCYVEISNMKISCVVSLYVFAFIFIGKATWDSLFFWKVSKFYARIPTFLINEWKITISM